MTKKEFEAEYGKPFGEIAELGPISDAIGELAAEKRKTKGFTIAQERVLYRNEIIKEIVNLGETEHLAKRLVREWWARLKAIPELKECFKNGFIMHDHPHNVAKDLIEFYKERPR